MATTELNLVLDTTFGVLGRLTGVQTSRCGWTAHCPCCGTANALTVSIDPLAVALLGLDCTAGCDRSRLYAWAGLPTPQRWLM